MALVYIHNTITWIQTWKQCVVFLQQTVPSKYTPSRCSFTTGADNFHTKAKNSNEMPNNCFTMYIFRTDVLTYLPIQQSQAFAHLHTAKIKTFRHVTLTHKAGCLGKFHYSRNFLHSLLCSYNAHTNHCPEQNESNLPHLSTLILRSILILYSQLCLFLPRSPCSFRYSEHAPLPWQGTCCPSPSIRPQYMFSHIKITISVELDNQGQSFATHHNQIHMCSLM